ITKRIKVDERLLRSARGLCRELFNVSALPEDEDGLILRIRELIDKKIEEIHQMKQPYQQFSYPGLSLLNKGLEYFEQFHKGLDNVTFLTQFNELEDELLDWDEDIVSVITFFSTNQKNLFEQAISVVETYENNKGYFLDEKVLASIERLTTIVEDPIPYEYIKEIPELVHTFENYLESLIHEKKDSALAQIDRDFNELSERTKEYDVSDATRSRVQEFYEQLKADLQVFEELHRFDAAMQQSVNFKNTMNTVITQDINEARRRRKAQQEENERKGLVVDPTPANTPAVTIERELVDLKQLVPTKTLTTEEDVEEYIDLLSERLKAIVRNNKEIEIQ